MRFVPAKSIAQHGQLMVHREAVQHLQDLPGWANTVIGETTATALVSTVGNGHDFSCGRQFCAWLGLVPRQYSSGGKQRLGRITKAGDPYLRSLLVLGGAGRVGTGHAPGQPQARPAEPRARALAERRGYWRAVVAIAAKNARMCWAVLQRGEGFKMPAWGAPNRPVSAV